MLVDIYTHIKKCISFSSLTLHLCILLFLHLLIAPLSFLYFYYSFSFLTHFFYLSFIKQVCIKSLCEVYMCTHIWKCIYLLDMIIIIIQPHSLLILFSYFLSSFIKFLSFFLFMEQSISLSLSLLFLITNLTILHV